MKENANGERCTARAVSVPENCQAGGGFVGGGLTRHRNVSSTSENGAQVATYGRATVIIGRTAAARATHFRTHATDEIALSIAAWTTGHVGLIGHRYFGRRRRHDGLSGRRE